MISQLN